MNLPTKATKKYITVLIVCSLAFSISEYFHQSKLKAAKNEEKRLHDKIDILLRENTSKDERLDEISNEIQLKHEQYIELESKLSDKDIDIYNLKEKLNKLQNEKNNAEKKLKEIQVSRGSTGYRKLDMESTFYTAFCPTGCIGVTASGHSVKNTIHYDGMRIVAVDPDVIPLYSILKIELKNETIKAIALDTGGDIKRNRLDILVSTREEAYKLGRQQAKVTILREGREEKE